LFLPPQLHTVFQAIFKMETGLRDLIARRPDEEFRGIYVQSGLSPTRKNVLAPGAVGIYSAGSIYNPAQVMRDKTVVAATKKVDTLLTSVKDKHYVEMSVDAIRELIMLTMPDPAASEKVWNPVAVAESILQLATLRKDATGFVYVDRDRGLKEKRRETQGILDGGEAGTVPSDRLTLFMLRTSVDRSREAAWWPQVRFPSGGYAFAFSV